MLNPNIESTPTDVPADVPVTQLDPEYVKVAITPDQYGAKYEVAAIQTPDFQKQRAKAEQMGHSLFWFHGRIYKTSPNMETWSKIPPTPAGLPPYSSSAIAAIKKFANTAATDSTLTAPDSVTASRSTTDVARGVRPLEPTTATPSATQIANRQAMSAGEIKAANTKQANNIMRIAWIMGITRSTAIAQETDFYNFMKKISPRISSDVAHILNDEKLPEGIYSTYELNDPEANSGFFFGDESLKQQKMGAELINILFLQKEVLINNEIAEAAKEFLA